MVGALGDVAVKVLSDGEVAPLTVTHTLYSPAGVEGQPNDTFKPPLPSVLPVAPEIVGTPESQGPGAWPMVISGLAGKLLPVTVTFVPAGPLSGVTVIPWPRPLA